MKSSKQLEAKLPPDLRKAIYASPRAKATWVDITPFMRRDWIYWLNTAKLAETRTRRIKKACSMLSSGKRHVCCFGGINWLKKTGQI